MLLTLVSPKVDFEVERWSIEEHGQFNPGLDRLASHLTSSSLASIRVILSANIVILIGRGRCRRGVDVILRPSVCKVDKRALFGVVLTSFPTRQEIRGQMLGRYQGGVESRPAGPVHPHRLRAVGHFALTNAPGSFPLLL